MNAKRAELRAIAFAFRDKPEILARYGLTVRNARRVSNHRGRRARYGQCSWWRA